jgi:hypothetical protein
VAPGDDAVEYDSDMREELGDDVEGPCLRQSDVHIYVQIREVCYRNEGVEKKNVVHR